jgi:hypothetical protein
VTQIGSHLPQAANAVRKTERRTTTHTIARGKSGSASQSHLRRNQHRASFVDESSVVARQRPPQRINPTREGTKQAQVLAMLRGPAGTTVAQIVAAMTWAPHTVRGFFAGLKKRHGIAVTAAERARQVVPNREGAKGSYIIYRIAAAG